MTSEELQTAADHCEEIAEELERISDGAQRLLSGRLNERAIVLLIHDAIKADVTGKPRKGDIRRVLEAAASLGERHLADNKGDLEDS